MNPLVKKEIRLLLPAWIVALLLALPPVCTRSDDGIPAILLFIGMTLMALSSIGRETTLNTFSQLLSQPAERTRIWRVKLSVLSVAFLMVFAIWRLAFAFSFKDYGGNPADVESTRAVLFASWMTLITTFTGALWTTLLLRQVAGALWITLLAPACLAAITAVFLDGYDSSEIMIGGLSVVLGIYSLAGFLFARRLFFRAQDAGWTGGIITLPEWKLFGARSESAGEIRRQKPILALMKKEFQLQQVAFAGAAAFLILHLGIIALRKFHHFPRNSAGELLVSIFWMLWLVMPVVIGGMAVADERRLGVLEGQLCLPVSRHVQFAIKASLTLLLGVLLGGVMPLLLETIAPLIGAVNPDFNPRGGFGSWQMFAIGGIAAWLAVVSFFASSLANNFLQAVGLAIAAFFGCTMVIPMFARGRMLFFDAWPVNSILPLIIAVPTMIVTLLWLAYLNFKNFRDGWPLWRRNLLGFAGAFVFTVVTSAALYNRVWEVFEPAEPAHGQAKLSLSNLPALYNDDYNNLLVRLPDGRVWFDYLKRSYDGSWRFFIHPLPRSAGPQQFLAGSNWVSATAMHINFESEGKGRTKSITGFLDTVGVQADGTLWISDTLSGFWTGDKMTRFGKGTDWRQAVRSRVSVLLLKNDGTLWRWGTNRFDWNQLKTNWPSLRNYQPHQIGTDSNWKELWDMWGTVAQKSDGSVWKVGVNDKIGKDELLRETNMDQVSLKNFSSSGGGERAYVRPDGTLWISWLFEQNGKSVYSDFVRVGTETNWSAVALNWQRMIALKSDGSLWQWPFFHRWNMSQEQFTIIAAQEPLTRLGIHNDWIAITGTREDVIALAADGSLWLWPNREQYEQSTLLKLPRQPQFLGNVFGKPD